MLEILIYLIYFAIKGELGEEGNRGPPGRQGAEGEPGRYIPELDEIIEGNIGIQGDLGQHIQYIILFNRLFSFTKIFEHLLLSVSTDINR